MKISNWRRKLASTLVAGGMISPAAAHAANLNANLVTNGTFENVNLAVTGEYNAPLVLDWTGPNLFAYSHNGSSSSAGVVPDYADGADPPSAGNWYFTPNNTGQVGDPPVPDFTDVHDPNIYYQDIAVGTGATGTAIAAGKGRVDLSAYMSSYLNDTDFANVRVEYRDALGATLGFAQISDSDPGTENVWSLNSGSGAISALTTTLRVSLFGTRTAGGGGADGYTDNVDVRVIETANPQFIFLEVNTTTGQASIKNQTGGAINIDYYQITSAGNALKANTWTSLQDQNLAGFPAGNGSGNGWEEAGGSGTGVLSESFLTGSSSAANASTINLGAAFNTAGAQDLRFSYAVVPQTPRSSDFDGDLDVDGADFLTWQRGLGIATGALRAEGDANGNGAVDAADLAIWRSQFGQGAASGTGVLQFGFVRYVTGAAAAVPEPSTVFLAGLGIAALTLRRRNNDRD